MTIEERNKQEMLKNIESAKYYLEHALSVVECDDRFNDGQSSELNMIYDKISRAMKELDIK